MYGAAYRPTRSRRVPGGVGGAGVGVGGVGVGVGGGGPGSRPHHRHVKPAPRHFPDGPPVHSQSCSCAMPVRQSEAVPDAAPQQQSEPPIALLLQRGSEQAVQLPVAVEAVEAQAPVQMSALAE